MVILDTNVFYYLSGTEVNKEVDLPRLQAFVDKNKCMCSIYSYFEILNASVSYEKKLQVLNWLSRNDIQIEYNDAIKEKIVKFLSHKPVDESYYNTLKHIYGEFIIDQISNNIAFFIVSYAYASATIFIDYYQSELSDQKLYFRKHFVILQHDVDRHIRRLVKKKLTKLLYEDAYNAENVQNLMLDMIANLMTYYYEWLKHAKILFEKQDKQAYYKLIKIFKGLNKQLLKDDLCEKVSYDFRYLSVCKILIDKLPEIEDLPNIKPSQAKKILKAKILNSIYFVDSETINEFEAVWLERNIDSILVESAKMKPNDFIDYEILRELYYRDENEFLVTFDGKMKTILGCVKSLDKFRDSLNLIQSFKKNG